MNDWPGPAWLDCDGQDAGDGKVRCNIHVVGGKREIVVPAGTFDAQKGRLKVRVVRPSQSFMDGNYDCPSQESESFAFTVECPGLHGETTTLDILAGFLNERIEEPEQAGNRAT